MRPNTKDVATLERVLMDALLESTPSKMILADRLIESYETKQYDVAIYRQAYNRLKETYKRNTKGWG
jgi:hypothetical protein